MLGVVGGVGFDMLSFLELGLGCVEGTVDLDGFLDFYVGLFLFGCYEGKIF